MSESPPDEQWKRVLRAAAHRVSRAPKASDLADRVRGHLRVQPGATAPGEEVELHLELRNVSDAPITIGLTSHGGPMLDVVAEGPAGTIHEPAGAPRPGFPTPVAVTLASGQALAHTRTWHAPGEPGDYRLRLRAMFDWAGHGLEDPVAELEVTG